MSVVVIKVMMHLFIQQIFVEYWGYTSKKNKIFFPVWNLYLVKEILKKVLTRKVYITFFMKMNAKEKYVAE